jgi:phosphatidate cytidylyltransferase
MSTTVKRILTFIIGVPAVLIFVFLNLYNHLPLNLLIIFFSILGTIEFHNMVSSKIQMFPKWLIVIFTALIPIINYIFSLTSISQDASVFIFVIEVVILMAIEALSKKTFESSFTKLASSFLIIFYCGFIFTYLQRFTVFENSIYIISLFLILVFMCDSAAWLFGVLFGKNNRGFIAASPKKSIVGFLGGIAASIVFGCLFKVIFPEIFVGSYAKMILLSLITAMAAIVGDLIESVFKRSLDTKDSGTLIPGRGGVLDSIDSILIAAPIFYIGIYFIYNIY